MRRPFRFFILTACICVSLQAAQVTNDTVRAINLMARAGQLQTVHSKETFLELLKIIQEKNPEVSYAAIESIEKRADIPFADLLIQGVAKMQPDMKWSGYRALGKYPTKPVLDWLSDQYFSDIEAGRNKELWYSKNAFYLAQSIEQIFRKLSPKTKIEMREGDEYSAFDAFAKVLRRKLSEIPPSPSKGK